MPPIASTMSPHSVASTNTKEDSLKIEYAPTKMAAAIKTPAIESAWMIPKYLLRKTPTTTAIEENTSITPISPPVLRAVEPYFLAALLIHKVTKRATIEAIEAMAIAASAFAITLCSAQAL